MIDPDEWVLHPRPVWGDRVDFVANVRFDDSGPGTRRFEQLLLERRGADTAVLCCVPFFTYGYSLGDVVELVDAPEFGWSPGAVVERSDQWSMRAFLTEDAGAPALEQLLVRHGAVVETRGRLVAFSVDGVDRLGIVRGELDALEAAGLLAYETAWP